MTTFLLRSSLVAVVAVALSGSRSAHAQSTPSPAPLSTADIAQRATPATATILAISASGDTLGQGSGFVIRADGVIVTNFHVLRGASSAIVTLSSKERYTRVRLIDADSALDLAILKVPAVAMAVLRTRATTPRVGERAIAIGSPLGLSQTVSDGIVSAVRVVDGRELIQITAPISPGSSGGAVLDASGRVFAISTLYLKSGQSLNFAVPVRYALGLLDDPQPERSIAQVFSGLSGGESRGADDASAGRQPSATLATTRHPHPHPSVSGTYGMSQVWTDSAGKVTSTQAGLLIATEDVGFLVMVTTYADSSKGPMKAYPVVRWATNPAGDVVLIAGGMSYDGYQTADDGFMATGSVTATDGRRMKGYLGGVPKRIPLSSDNGLYDVSLRTRYAARGVEVGKAFDWSGDAAVAIVRDSIYVDVLLKNSAGGSAVMTAAGPLTEQGHFDLVRAGISLSGRVASGMLTGDWVDKRDGGGAFTGTLRATRR